MGNGKRAIDHRADPRQMDERGQAKEVSTQ